MRTLSDSTDTRGDLPLTEAALAATRHEIAWSLGDLPFFPGAASRSLWVVFIGAAGVWTHAVLPVDDRLDKPDPGHITRLSKIVGLSLEFPLFRSGEEALVVLRRPAPAAISEADAYVFRLVCEATATGATAPWRFYVTGPDGARECSSIGLLPGHYDRCLPAEDDQSAAMDPRCGHEDLAAAAARRRHRPGGDDRLGRGLVRRGAPGADTRGRQRVPREGHRARGPDPGGSGPPQSARVVPG